MCRCRHHGCPRLSTKREPDAWLVTGPVAVVGDAPGRRVADATCWTVGRSLRRLCLWRRHDDMSQGDRLASAGSSGPGFPFASRQEMTVNIKGGLHLTAGVGRANWLANLDDLNRRTR
jgi:hypothetical protein